MELICVNFLLLQLGGDFIPVCLYVCFQHTQSLNFRRQHRTKCDAGGEIFEFYALVSYSVFNGFQLPLTNVAR